MNSDPQLSGANLQNLQHQLVVLLRDPNCFSFDDIHRYWQEYIDATVDWSAILRSGKTQAELAGDLVANVTRKGNIAKFAAVIREAYKGVVPGLDFEYNLPHRTSLDLDVEKDFVYIPAGTFWMGNKDDFPEICVSSMK